MKSSELKTLLEKVEGHPFVNALKAVPFTSEMPSIRRKLGNAVHHHLRQKKLRNEVRGDVAFLQLNGKEVDLSTIHSWITDYLSLDFGRDGAVQLMIEFDQESPTNKVVEISEKQKHALDDLLALMSRLSGFYALLLYLAKRDRAFFQNSDAKRVLSLEGWFYRRSFDNCFNLSCMVTNATFNNGLFSLIGFVKVIGNVKDGLVLPLSREVLENGDAHFLAAKDIRTSVRKYLLRRCFAAENTPMTEYVCLARGAYRCHDIAVSHFYFNGVRMAPGRYGFIGTEPDLPDTKSVAKEIFGYFFDNWKVLEKLGFTINDFAHMNRKAASKALCRLESKEVRLLSSKTIEDRKPTDPQKRYWLQPLGHFVIREIDDTKPDAPAVEPA